MVVVNSHRTTAIVIRHDGRRVMLVAMKSGRLHVTRLDRESFEREWRPMDYDLARALTLFLEHAAAHGATREAIQGLGRLEERERLALASLF